MSDGKLGQEESNIILHEANVHPADAPIGDVHVEHELNELNVLIETGEWDTVEDRLQSHPQELHNESSTALHLALEGGECPFNIIKTMIEMDPLVALESSSQPKHTFAYGMRRSVRLRPAGDSDSDNRLSSGCFNARQG